MNIKFAKEIIKDIEKQGTINTLDGYVNGEEFEKWLYQNPTTELDVNELEAIKRK